MTRIRTTGSVGQVFGLTALALALGGGPGFAQTTSSQPSVKSTNVNKNSNASASQSAAVSGSVSSALANQGNNNGAQSVQLNTYTPSKQTIENVPNIYAPGLAAAGTEICLGSVSAGGAAAGFGLSIGGTFVDKECQLRLNARTLATLGYAKAAREEMCLDADVRSALAAAGTPCEADAHPRANSYTALASSSPSVPPKQVVSVPVQVASALPVQVASARDCERRYQLLGGWYEVCQ